MLRGDFGTLQRGAKGVKLKFGERDVGQTSHRRWDGRNDGGTYAVNVALTMTLYGICVYTVDGEKLCFC